MMNCSYIIEIYYEIIFQMRTLDLNLPQLKVTTRNLQAAQNKTIPSGVTGVEVIFLDILLFRG